MRNVNDSDYNEVVLNSDKLVVVDFYADWCGPCKVLGPILESMEHDNPDAEFVKIDVDDSTEVPSKYGIRNIPTVLFVKNGEVVDKIVGSSPKDKIQKLIDNLVY